MFGSKLLESQHSSSSPKRILLTSTYGSQTTKPRPIKSMAALRSGVYAGNCGVAGVSTKWANANATNLGKLLLPINPAKIN